VPLDLLLPLISFAFVSSVTPGPNNLMLLASGVNFGFSRTIPHMLGIGAGFMLMILLIGIGLGELFRLVPELYVGLRYVGAAYMLLLAWRLARAGGVGDAERPSRPMSFLQAAAFQWVNPKAWVMAVYAIATFTLPTQYLVSVLVVTLVFGLINIPCVGSWAMFGTALRRYLTEPRIVRVFNGVMAALLVASIVPILRH